MEQGPPSKVVAVVPTFRPSPANVSALAELSEQVYAVVAVDDGSGPSWPFEGLPVDRVALTRLPDNGGIGRSLNEGVVRARSQGATHVLTVDQDSRLAPGYVEAALRTLADLADAGVVAGGIGAGRIGPHRLEGASVTATVRDGSRGVQSGWLLPIETVDAVGPFDETLFIDCVDVDFAARAARAGRPVLATDACAIEHPLGAEERVLRLLGRRIAFSLHPPFRRYYILRNRLVMIRRYGPGGTMLSQLAVAVRIAALGLLFGRRRRAQLLAIGTGLVHGALGRVGRIPPRVERALATAA